MNQDSSDMNFEHAQSSPDQSAKPRQTTSSGAGVNAESKVEKKIAGSYALSESIWYAHRGFGLKYASSSLTDKVPSPMRSTEPSNMVLSPMHSIRAGGTNDDESITDRKLIKPAELAIYGEAATGTYLAKESRISAGSLFGCSPTRHSGTRYDEEELNPVEDESVVHLGEKQEPNYKDQTDCCPKDIQFEDVAGTSKTTGEQCPESTNCLALLTNKTKHEQVHEKIYGKKKSNSSGRADNVASGTQILGLKTHGSQNASLEGLEYSSENIVQLVTEKDACEQGERGSRMERSYPVKVMPREDNKINLLQWKGRKMTLAVNDVNENLSKDDDDSNESVESCNSASSLSKGKKRGSSEQQLVVECKRIKSLSQEAPTSTFPIKSDSSFMNWIANMVKGVAKANQEERAPALNLNHLDQRLVCYNQKDPARNKNHDPGTRNMGFQSIFQSLYRPNTMSSERTSNDNRSISGAKESLDIEKPFMNVMPISFFRENDECYRQFRVENIDSNHHTSGNGQDLSAQTSSQPRAVSANNGSTPGTWKTKSVHDKGLVKLRCSDENDGIRSAGALLGTQKLAVDEENSLHLPSEGKVTSNMRNNDDPLNSLWITRFSSKKPCRPIDLDHPGSTHRMLNDSSECETQIPQHLFNYSFSPKSSEAAETCAKNPANAVVNNTRNCTTSLEGYTGFNKFLRQNHEKPIYIQKSTSSTSKRLEPMTTEFARRLEVLKSIPSDAKDDAELTARQHTIWRSGETPTADDLRSKLQDKQKLGL